MGTNNVSKLLDTSLATTSVTTELRNPPETLEEWFPDKKRKLTLDEARLYFHAAWRDLNKKLIVFTVVLGTVAAAVTLFLSNLVPESVRWLSVILFGLAALIILITTAVRANSSLIVTSINLVKFVNDQKARIGLLSASVEAFKKKAKTHSDLYVCNADMYGIALEQSHVRMDVAANGSVNAEYELQILATRPGITAIERFTSSSLEIDADLSVLGAEEQRFKVKKDLFVILTPEMISKTPNLVTWKLKASPEFPAGVVVEYKYSPHVVPKAFLMTSRELYETRFDIEWISHNIAYPEQELTLELIFPEGFNPTNYDFDVWHSSGVQVRNYEEYNRLREMPTAWKKKRYRDDRLRLTLNVPYPLLGLTYAITWVPPAIWRPPQDQEV